MTSTVNKLKGIFHTNSFRCSGINKCLLTNCVNTTPLINTLNPLLKQNIFLSFFNITTSRNYTTSLTHNKLNNKLNNNKNNKLSDNNKKLGNSKASSFAKKNSKKPFSKQSSFQSLSFKNINQQKERKQQASSFKSSSNQSLKTTPTTTTKKNSQKVNNNNHHSSSPSLQHKSEQKKNQQTNEERKLSKLEKKMLDYQRITNWKKQAEKKQIEKQEKEILLSTKLETEKTIKVLENEPKSNIVLKVEKLKAGKRRVGEKEKKIELNEFYPKLFTSKNFIKLEKEEEEEIGNNNLPKVAFAGRSNVGKSSLINALVTKKGVGGKAVVSSKPGETQDVTLFRLGHVMNVIDLPGYGFAFADEETRELWQQRIKDYLVNATNLKRVFVLVDVRHGLKQSDYTFLTFLNQNKIKNQIVLTKVDLLFSDEIAKRYELINTQIKQNPFNYTVEEILMISSKKLTGIKQFQETLLSFLSDKGKEFKESEEEKAREKTVNAKKKHTK
ncbi:hypothetical protein ABK040_003700 [Willaertia magna]